MTLTVYEQHKLDSLEATIERGLQTFSDVGTSLAEIRDERLYRRDYDTFEEYCRARWGFTRMRASQLISAAVVSENVNNCLHAPTTESQVRPLASLSPEDQRAVWQQAVDTAPNGKITAAHVERTVREYAGETDTDEPSLPSISERELTAMERAWRLCFVMMMGRTMTTTEIVDFLGYSSYSGAASMLDRQRFEGLYRGDDGKWRLLVDAKDWPY